MLSQYTKGDVFILQIRKIIERNYRVGAINRNAIISRNYMMHSYELILRCNTKYTFVILFSAVVKLRHQRSIIKGIYKLDLKFNNSKKEIY